MASKDPDPADARVQTNLDTRTVPDPSVLTTAQILREVAAAREIIETRLKCIEEHQDHAREFLNQRQSTIDAEVKHILTLHKAEGDTIIEKFRSVDVRFSERGYPDGQDR